GFGLVIVRPAPRAGALAAAACPRSPALARADRLAWRHVCSLSADALAALHGAANGACARRPTTTTLKRCGALFVFHLLLLPCSLSLWGRVGVGACGTREAAPCPG